MSSERFIKALMRLLDHHPNGVAASVFTLSQRKQLAEFESRTQSIQATTKGRGVIYEIRDIGVVEATVHRLSPCGLTPFATSSLPNRAENIAISRSSKSGRHEHEVTYVLLKTRHSPNWRWQNGEAAQFQALTDSFGAFTLEIGGAKNNELSSVDEVWLVENQALFDRLDWLPHQRPVTVIWYRGQLHRKLLAWLSDPKRAPKIFFFADYDGVGLNNFRRLFDVVGDKAEFWMMPNWRPLLNQYGQNALWLDTQRDFQSFERHSQSLFDKFDDVKDLVITMKSLGLALEQEAIWLNIQEK